MGSLRIIEGDALETLRGMDAGSVDAIVTDPPYGLRFMGKEWDHGIPGVPVWTEALRVAKPGAHLLAFGGTRTFHRLMVAIEDAGWELRDTIMWVYSSGFPKSHNGPWGGTALKPAWEPVVVARKPLCGTVAENVLQYGTGALNIDACRIASEDSPTAVRRGYGYTPNTERASDSQARGALRDRSDPDKKAAPHPSDDLGRWPANLIHDGSEEVAGLFPHTSSGQVREGHLRHADSAFCTGGDVQLTGYGDSGSAARFFYCAKASREDRNAGLDDPGPQFTHGTTLSKVEKTATNGNTHPTVKPTDLMRYLCRLVTPPRGTVLDPFMGSGSTGKAALMEGFGFIGIELNPAYVAIAERRCAAARAQEVLTFTVPVSPEWAAGPNGDG